MFNIRNTVGNIPTQVWASLVTAAFLSLAFFVVELELSRNAPAFQGHSLYSFLVLSLIGLVSGCAGWACGLVLSPMGSQMGGAQKVLAGVTVFWSGAVFSHLDKLTGFFDAWQKAQMTSATKIEFLFGLGVFLLAFCVTFNTRFDQGKTSDSKAGNVSVNESST